MFSFVIRGVVREAESGVPLGHFPVKAYDKDLLFDDLLGTAVTEIDGRFEIVSEAEDFSELFEKKPDIYIRVLHPKFREEVFHTGVRWNAGRLEEFDIAVPRECLGDLAPRRDVVLLDDEGRERTDFDAGEDLRVQIGGLTPRTPHEIAVHDDRGPLFTARLMTDREGAIRDAVLWAQAGLDDPRTGEAMTPDQAEERWAGAELRLEIRAGERVVAESTVRFAERFTRPVLFASDADGRVANGFEAGEAAARLAAHRVPFRGDAMVFLVPSQRDWRPGDRFEPITLESGRTAAVAVQVSDDARIAARIARPRELRPGAYDFVVRPLRYGYEDDDDFELRRDDLVTRRFTGLVVREEFMASKVVLGSCVNQQSISGRKISGKPYFQFADTFQLGEDVWGALDPAALDPNLVGKMTALYVVPHKDAAGWTASKALAHLPQLGGNPGVTQLKTQANCINYNDVLLWPNCDQEGEFDIVADFGNDTTDPNAFNPDDTFTPPLDLIDGYYVAGFRVVPDPTTDTQFAHAGTFEYSEPAVTVQDDYGPKTVERKAVVHFPADVAGTTQPSQISGSAASYPMVIVVHGNSSATTSYQGYDYLLEHLAKNGFIAASIHLDPGMQGTGRARMLFHHIDELKARFGATAQNNIGIMGHSRGGEAVAIAARLNQQEALGHDIRAVISLAPTDQYTSEDLGGAWATPYMVVYGSMDGDVAGGGALPMNTGFALYDRADGAPKSMVFAYGATHGRFNTVWGDTDLGFGKIGPDDLLTLISMDAHQKIAKGYMTAFFRRHQRNELQWDGIFHGEWRPAAVEQADGGAVDLYLQYRDPSRKDVDTFEGAHTATSWENSTIGGSVDDDDTLPVDPVEDDLKDLDSQTPHDTSGLLLRWDNTTDRLRFDVPSAHKNVTAYAALSFRITQKVGSAHNPAGQAQDLYATLEDTGGKSRSIKVSKFTEVPPPHERQYSQYTKSAMTTVRIPLHVFTIEVINTDPVDLANIVSLTLDFKAKSAGEVEIDSVSFTD